MLLVKVNNTAIEELMVQLLCKEASFINPGMCLYKSYCSSLTGYIVGSSLGMSSHLNLYSLIYIVNHAAG